MMYALFVAENFLVRLWEFSRIRVENRNRETECASGQNFPEILEFLYRRILLEFPLKTETCTEILEFFSNLFSIYHKTKQKKNK